MRGWKVFLVLFLVLTGAGCFPLKAAMAAPAAGTEALSKSSKYKVCSITINSSEEISAFREYLPEDHFEFVELLPSEGERAASSWFERACRESLQCDVLVFSGHFGGKFTGASGYALALSEMERMACSQKCPGILSAAREVFLFGCNTLAGKKLDSRQPEDYLQALLDEGYPRGEAERAVAVRYSSLETSFEQRMRLVFASSGRQSFLYGFHSKSPYGKNFRHMLEDYFQRTAKEMGGYYEHLSLLNESRFPNPFWSRSLRLTHQAQSLSARFEDTDYQAYQEFCGLYDKGRGDLKNMILADSLLRRGETGFYFRHILNFLQRREMFFGAEARRLYEEAQNDGILAGRWAEKYKKEGNMLKKLPLLRFDYLLFLRQMQWISQAFYDSEAADIVRGLVLGDFSDKRRSLGRLGFQDRSVFQSAGFSLRDFPKGFFGQPENLKSLGLIRPSDPKIHYKITESLQSGDRDLKTAALRALGLIRSNDPAIHWKISESLDDADPLVRKTALLVFGWIQPDDPGIHLKIAGLLGAHEDIAVQKEALWALGMIRPSEERIHWEMAGFLGHENSSVWREALLALGRAAPSDPLIHWMIAESLDEDDGPVLKSALSALGAIRPPEERIHWEAAGFLGHEDGSVWREALLALRKIRPSDPAIHLKIAAALGAAPEPLQKEALLALAEIRPSDPQVNLKAIEALGHKSRGLRQQAFLAVAKIKPAQMGPYSEEACRAVSRFYNFERHERRLIDLESMGLSCPP